MGVAGEIAFRRRCRLFSEKKKMEKKHTCPTRLCANYLGQE